MGWSKRRSTKKVEKQSEKKIDTKERNDHKTNHVDMRNLSLIHVVELFYHLVSTFFHVSCRWRASYCAKRQGVYRTQKIEYVSHQAHIELTSK